MAGRRFCGVLTLAAGAATIGLAVYPASGESFPVEHREPITIRVLSGKSGGPLMHQRLTLVAGYDARDLEERLWTEETVTDAAGEARVPLALGNFPFLRVKVAKTRLCQETSRGETYNLGRVRYQGFSAPNHCGFVTVADAPRVLVVFVRRGARKVKISTSVAATGVAGLRENIVPSDTSVNYGAGALGPASAESASAEPGGAGETRAGPDADPTPAAPIPHANEIDALLEPSPAPKARIAHEIGPPVERSQASSARRPNEIDSLNENLPASTEGPTRGDAEPQGTGVAGGAYEEMCEPEL
jgi:hypothetical protein